MSKSNPATIRRARLIRLAILLQKATKQGRKAIAVAELYPRFHGATAFGQLANLHCFLSRLPLVIERHGQGGGGNNIPLESAKPFIAEHLRIQTTPAPVWDCPEFEPVGDLLALRFDSHYLFHVPPADHSQGSRAE